MNLIGGTFTNTLSGLHISFSSSYCFYCKYATNLYARKETYVYFVFANRFYTKRDILFFVYNKYVEIDLHVSQ